MTKEYATTYLRCSGFSEEQIKEISDALKEWPKPGDWIVPIILIDKKGEEHDGLMDKRRMLIYLHNIPAETAISLGYTWKSAEGGLE